MIGPSIRRRLVLLVLASIALVWGGALVSSYRQATREVGLWEEARLAELAQMLALLDATNLMTLANARIDVREEEKSGEAGASNFDDDDTLPRDAFFRCARPTASCWQAARNCTRSAHGICHCRPRAARKT